MVSIPYSKPLWFVSEEVVLDSESVLSKDGQLRVGENSHDHIPCFLLKQCYVASGKMTQMILCVY